MTATETKADVDLQYDYSTVMRSLVIGLWKLPPRYCLQNRRFHAFCIGTSKSGTHSIVDMFPDEYRVAHEPGAQLLNKLIIDHQQGRVSDQYIHWFYRLRDIRDWVELESNYYNFCFVHHLVELFPQARFILTLRSPASWLDSWINHTIDRREVDGSIWADGLAAIYTPQRYEYGAEEVVFRRYGLWPLACYLDYWRTHNLKVLEAVPEERLLVIRTNDITHSTEQLASFLGIPHQGFKKQASHSFKAKAKHGVLEEIDPDYLQTMIQRYSDARITQYLDGAGSAFNHGQKSATLSTGR
ncbi:MAG: sulfotransferase [Marinobacter sp.]|nr:sulfotransferase [Marinobacter sp.]